MTVQDQLKIAVEALEQIENWIPHKDEADLVAEQALAEIKALEETR